MGPPNPANYWTIWTNISRQILGQLNLSRTVQDWLFNENMLKIEQRELKYIDLLLLSKNFSLQNFKIIFWYCVLHKYLLCDLSCVKAAYVLVD